MKWILGGLLFFGGAGVLVAGLFMTETGQDCCEYLGLLAPDGVSEVPGVDHADIAEARDDGQIPESVPGLKLNDRVEPFELADLDGKSHTVDCSQSEVTVVVWVSGFCPTSKIYEARLNALRDSFRGRVKFWAINSSAMESVEDLKEHFRDSDEDRLDWTILKDDQNVIADQFGAMVSTDTFVFDREGRLQYRGAVDDARNPQRVEVEYLRRVLGRVLDGRDPEWRYQAPKGCCPIDRVETKKAPNES